MASGAQGLFIDPATSAVLLGTGAYLDTASNAGVLSVAASNASSVHIGANTAVAGSLGASNLLCPRNKIVNGAMSMDQRASGAATVVGADLGYVPVVSLNAGMSNFGWANASNRPTFDSNNNQVTFARASSQYLDGGSQTFNMALNGFTCTAAVMFTGTAGTYERIIDLGSGSQNNNVLFTRNASDSSLYAGYYVGTQATPNQVTTTTGTVSQNTLYIVSCTVTTANTISIYINGSLSASNTGTLAPTNRTVTNTYIGRSAWYPSDAYTNANIYYLSAYDACFSAAEVAQQHAILRDNLFTRANTIPYSLPSAGPTLPAPVVSVTPASYSNVTWSQPAGQSPYVDTANKLIRFDRSKSQYLDFGSQTFTMATTGFTATAVVMFTGAPGYYERVFDFNTVSGATYPNNNVTIARVSTNQQIFSTYANGSFWQTNSTNVNFSQNQILYVTVTISASGVHTFYVNGASTGSVSTGAPTTRTFTQCFVGRSPLVGNEPTANMNLYYFAAYNATFSADQVAQQHLQLQTTLLSLYPSIAGNSALMPVAPTVLLTPLMKDYPWAANSATWDTSNNAVMFNRASSQFIDAGPKTFNMATNGFSFTAVSMFTGTAGDYERFIEFGTSTVPASTTNQFLIAKRTNGDLYIEYSNSNVGTGKTYTNVLQQNTLYNVTVTLTNAGVITAYINGSSLESTTLSAPVSRTSVYTYIGRNIHGNPFLNGNIYFLAAYDATLSAAQVTAQHAALAALIRPTPIYQVPTLDRMLVYHDAGAGAGSWLVQRDTDVPPVAGVAYSLRLQHVTGPGSTLAAYGGVGQRIEGYQLEDLRWGTAAAAPATVSFWIKSSVAGTLMMTVGNAAQVAVASQQFVAPVVVSAANTWEYKSVVVPAPPAGVAYWALDAGPGLRWNLSLAAASNVYGLTSATSGWVSGAGYERLAASTNLMGTQGLVVKLTAVQLERGSAATVFEARHDGLEAALNAIVPANVTVDKMAAMTESTGYGNLVINGNISAGNLGMFRNRIINGDMRIDQRYAGAVNSNNVPYTVDRWNINENGGDLTKQQVTDVPTGMGFTNSIKITVNKTYATGVNGLWSIRQSIEGNNISDMGFGVSTSTPNFMTFSFWMKSSVKGTIGVYLTANNNTNVRTYCTSAVINNINTWEYKTFTIPVDTFSSHLNNGLNLYAGCILYTNGSSLVSNAWQTTNEPLIYNQPLLAPGCTNFMTSGNVLFFTGFQLEKGTVATPFEFRPLATELVLCQRYYQQFINTTANSFYLWQRTNAVAANNGIPLNLFYKVTMRAAPTFTRIGTWSVFNCGQPIATVVTPESITINVEPLAAGDCFFYAQQNVGLSLSAEL